jgi:hypothetical protein
MKKVKFEMIIKKKKNTRVDSSSFTPYSKVVSPELASVDDISTI